jgi:hypothetical protein
MRATNRKRSNRSAAHHAYSEEAEVLRYARLKAHAPKRPHGFSIRWLFALLGWNDVRFTPNSGHSPPFIGAKVLWSLSEGAVTARRRRLNVFHYLHSALYFHATRTPDEAATFVAAVVLRRQCVTNK